MDLLGRLGFAIDRKSYVILSHTVVSGGLGGWFSGKQSCPFCRFYHGGQPNTLLYPVLGQRSCDVYIVMGFLRSLSFRSMGFDHGSRCCTTGVPELEMAECSD